MSDWPFEEYEQAVEKALRILKRYIDRSRRGREPVVRLRSLHEIAEELGLKRWIEAGSMEVESFEVFLEKYLANSTRLHHPGYLSHQVAVPDHPTGLAELVHGITNNPMAMYEMGPAAAAVELAVLDWMLEKAGWSSQGAGVLTHGGSLANLTALLAARATADPKAWDDGLSGHLAILAPPSAHYSVSRAASIIGLGANAVCSVEVNANEVIIPDRLPRALQRIRDDGKRVMAVVANACSTGTGLHDPIAEIASFCRDSGLWLHVDSAHGASALISKRERKCLSGIEQADSLIWDAHKMLRTSGLCTAVLFRDSSAFERAFQQEASYLFYGNEQPGVDLIHRTVECTKAPLGMKIFLMLAWRGEAGLARYVEELYELTRRLYSKIRSRPGFECPYAPESNILCFRFGSDDKVQISIREKLLAEGHFHISSTEIGGSRYLRLTVMSPQTTEDTIDALLDAIERIAG